MTTAPTSGITRRLAAAAVGGALIAGASWLTLRNLQLSAYDGWQFWVPIVLCLVTMGLLSWWTALQADDPASRGRIRSSWRAGWRVGAVGLALGFVGPLVVFPEGNLGPLLGILITGPAGFVLGALGGAVAGTARA
jgi:hypothetical protein